MNGYRLGYFHGWSDKKADRPYGERSQHDLDDQWERIAAVVRLALIIRAASTDAEFHEALNALTPDDIEAVSE